MAEGDLDEQTTEQAVTDDNEEWTFALDEVGPEAATAEPPLEPEAINPEHAVFFLLGVALFLALVIQVVL